MSTQYSVEGKGGKWWRRRLTDSEAVEDEALAYRGRRHQSSRNRLQTSGAAEQRHQQHHRRHGVEDGIGTSRLASVLDITGSR